MDMEKSSTTRRFLNPKGPPPPAPKLSLPVLEREEFTKMLCFNYRIFLYSDFLCDLANKLKKKHKKNGREYGKYSA